MQQVVIRLLLTVLSKQCCGGFKAVLRILLQETPEISAVHISISVIIFGAVRFFHISDVEIRPTGAVFAGFEPKVINA